MKRGRFVTLEGGEGSGKSTQARRLADSLSQRHGLEVILTREPGGSPGAEDIRRLLVEGAVGRWDATAEALLHFAARRSHVTETIWPALDRGAWVVSDRFADSTLAYQGYGQGLDETAIATLYALTLGDFRPDLTIVLDVPVATGLDRAAAERNRYERMSADFHDRVRKGFKEIAANDSSRCVLIDASQAIEAVAEAIWGAVGERLNVKSDL